MPAAVSPFVSELGAALLGWRRGYLGFPSHRLLSNRRRLVIVVLFLDHLGFGLVEGTAWDSHQIYDSRHRY